MKANLDVTEEEFLSAVEAVVEVLQKRFKGVAYLSDDDVGQELRLLALEVLPRFDRAAGPLNGYLYASVRNRWLNRVRSLSGRWNDPACTICNAAHLGQGPGHSDGECKAYRLWKQRNRARANLGRPHDITHVMDERVPQMKTPSTVETDAETAELLQFLDERLTCDERRVWLMMREGAKIEKKSRDELHLRLLEILEEAGLSAEDLGLYEQEEEVADDESDEQAA